MPIPDIDSEDIFRQAVKMMRDAQRKYIKTRDSEDRLSVLSLEGLVDMLLDKEETNE